MQGEVVGFSEATGEGAIRGADGKYYTFARGDRGGERPPRAGDQVDFTPSGQAALDVTLTAFWGPANEPGIWSYFVKCMRLYFDGRGRARRKEYWSFALFRVLFVGAFLIIGVLTFSLGLVAHAQTSDDSDAASAVFWLVWLVLNLPFIAPGLAVGARRLHDVGLSGWLLLLTFIPLIGGLFMFVVSLIPSQIGMNSYGRDPTT